MQHAVDMHVMLMFFQKVQKLQSKMKKVRTESQQLHSI